MFCNVTNPKPNLLPNVPRPYGNITKIIVNITTAYNVTNGGELRILLLQIICFIIVCGITTVCIRSNNQFYTKIDFLCSEYMHFHNIQNDRFGQNTELVFGKG